MESISEAYSKCFVADFIFSLSRTVEDKNNDSGRIFVAKNRNGADGLVFPIEMSTRNVRIRIPSTSVGTAASLPQNSSSLMKEQKETLSQMWVRHREKVVKNKEKEE